MNLSKLAKKMFPRSKLITLDQVHRLMEEHARRSGSVKNAADETGVSKTYWYMACKGKQFPGAKITSKYHLRHVDMWIVED